MRILQCDVYVNRITGQSYGYLSDIRISFHMDKQTVDYSRYSVNHGPYHLAQEDIGKLQSDYPQFIPKLGNPYYKGYVTEWGYDVEEGLCKLMINQLLLWDTADGKVVRFLWDPYTEPWEADRHRKKKRRFPRNPNLL